MAYKAWILDSTKAEVAALQDVTWEYTETLNAQDTLRATIFESDKFTHVTATNSFFRLVNPKDTTDKRTYRIQTVDEVHVDGRLGIQVTGHRIWQDMGREVYRKATSSPPGFHPFKGAGVSTLLKELMSVSGFQIKSGGDAESDTTVIDYLDTNYNTVLDLVQQIAEEAALEIEIDESTSPESLDLKARGAANNVPLRYRLNMPGITRRTRRMEVVNKVYPAGGGDPPATCMGAWFEVASVSTVTITVAGDRCIPSNDTYTDGEQIKMVTGTAAGNTYSISDTTRGATAGTDTVVSGTNLEAAGVAAGDLFKFVDASGNELDYVPDKSSIDTYGTFEGVVRDQSYESISSLITPGFMDGTYTAGLHDGWTKEGSPTTTENTDTQYMRHGDSAQKIVATGANEGIKQTVNLDTSVDFHSCSVQLYVESGSVQVEVAGQGTNPGTWVNQDGTSGTGFIKVDISGMEIEGSTAILTIQSKGGAATFHVDAVSFTPTQQTKQFVRENGARELYRLAFDYLEKHKTPHIEYTVQNAIDLYELDTDKYGDFQINVGDTLRVLDEELSLGVSVRVLTITKSSDRGRIGLKLSSQTDIEAAFNSIRDGSGSVVSMQRQRQKEANNQRRLQEEVADLTDRIGKRVPTTVKSPEYSGTFTSTGQTSLQISQGTLRAGDSETFAMLGAGVQTISGLAADTVYYLYVDPASVSSGFQTTTTAATVFSPGIIRLGVIKTGATSEDLIQVITGNTSSTPKNDITYSAASSYGQRIQNNNDGGLGYAGTVYYNNSASPANNDVVTVLAFRGNDDNGDQVAYAGFTADIASVANGAHRGRLELNTANAGSFGTRLSIDGQDITFNGVFTFPTADGSANQVLTTDGSGTLTWQSSPGSIDGTGTANYLPKWSDSDTLGNSLIYDNGTNIGINTTSPNTQDYTGPILELSGTGFPAIQLTKTNAGTGNTLGAITFSRTNTEALARIAGTTDGATDSAYIDFLTQPTSGALTTRMRITSGGFVGAGTTSPTARIHAQGTLNSNPILRTNQFGSDYGHYIYSGGVLASSRHGLFVYSDQNQASSPLVYFHNDHASSVYTVHVKNDGVQIAHFEGGADAFIALNATTNPFIAIQESGTRRCYIQYHTTDHDMRIVSEESGSDIVLLPDQYVGIGTSSPTGILHVTQSGKDFIVTGSGDITQDGKIAIGHTTNTHHLDMRVDDASNHVAYFFQDNASGTGVYIQSDATANGNDPLSVYTNSSVWFVVRGDGVVRIGDADQSYSGERHACVITETTANESNLLLQHNSSGGVGPVMTFHHNSTSQADDDIIARIDFEGVDSGSALQRYGFISAISKDVTAGTEDGAIRLDVLSNGTQYGIAEFNGEVDGVGLHNNGAAITFPLEVWVNSHSLPYIRVRNNAVNGSCGYSMVNWNQNWYMYVDGANSDNCTWWDGTRVEMYLTTAGQAYSYGWNTISDKRLKTEVEDARDYWLDFKKLKFHKYKFISDIAKGDHLFKFGLIAQEVQEIFPSCVDTDNESAWAIKTTAIQMIGLKVLTEAQAKIETIEEKVMRLESENIAFKNRVAALEAEVAAL